MMLNFKQYGDAVALLTADGVTSYAELDRETELLASHMPERCLVFCLCTNTPYALVGYASCLNHGEVPLLLAADMDSVLLANLIQTYKPDYLWMPKRKAEQYGYKLVYESMPYALVKTSYNHIYPLHSDLALLLTTSGSTGSPKLVRHTYDNLRSNIQAIVEYLEIDQSERPITTLPMNYTYGLSVLNIHLWSGASIIMTDCSLMQKEFWQLFRQYNATSMAGVPYTFEMLDRLRFFRMSLPSLRNMNQAGGKLSPELQQKFVSWSAKTGRRFYVMYGQTEASPRMGYLPWERAAEKYGCMGIPIPGGSFSIVDVDGKNVTEPNVVGELVYQGANVTPGYAQCGEDLIKGDERHGVLVTGDMAKCDSEGFYTIVGRKKRFLKIFGNRVNLDETERLIRAQFTNLDCACAGVDDTMYVFITDNTSNDAVLQFLAQKTGLNHVAFKLITIPAIPKSDSGKTLYSQLDHYYA